MNTFIRYTSLVFAVGLGILFFSGKIDKQKLTHQKSITIESISALASETSTKNEERLSIGSKNQISRENVDKKQRSQIIDESQKKDTTEPLSPSYLVIPVINVQASVLAMGLEPDGKMAVPNDYVNVGWYSLGSKPGSMGSAVMGAHVDNGYFTPGVFKNLKELKIGDDIYVKDDNNETIHFKVEDVKIYPYTTTDTNEVFNRSDKKRLVLITCHGNFIPKENTYDQRLVVYAEMVE